MPLIEVLGTPWMFPWSRRKFKRKIKEAVAAIPEMELTTDQISVLTFREAGGFDGEIHVRVTFNERAKRTVGVRETLTQKIAEVVERKFRWNMFRRLKLIEVWGNPFSKNNGFFFIENKRELY